MNELIKIDYSNDRLAVSARDLHEFLEVGADYRHWLPRMIEYGFAEGQDFNMVKIDRVKKEGNRMVSRLIDDAILSIDMAKEICMLQRNEKGKAARQYFIQLEKDWNSPDKVMARALQIADKKIKALEAQIEVDRPKVIFYDAVETAKTSILIGELAKLMKQNGINIGQNRLFKWLRENGWLCTCGDKYNMPTQKGMNAEYFEVKETTYTRPNCGVCINKQTRVTGKGQTYFINKFLDMDVRNELDFL